MISKFLYTFAALILFAFSSLMARESKLITGTIGKEHMIGKKLVICELGTQACMFLDIDTDLEIKIDGKIYKPEELQVGWYTRVKVETRENKSQVITHLTVDPRKTIICFSNLDDKQSKTLEKQLQRTKGIVLVKTYLKSRQVYIEYNPKTISYPDIENLIVRAGYKIE